MLHWIAEWISEKLEAIEAAAAGFILTCLVLDLLHFADGHTDCRACPPPWGRYRSAELLGKPRAQ